MNAPLKVAVIAWGAVGDVPSATDGNQPRKFSVVQHLAQQNDVTFVSLVLAGDSRHVVLPDGVELVEVDIPRSTLRTQARIKATVATLARRTTEHEWQRNVLAALDERGIDVVVTMWMVRLPWLGRRFPVVTFLEEDMRRQPENPSSLGYRMKQAVDTWAVNRGLAASVGVAVISPHELAWARAQLPGVPVGVVPHWVNQDYWSAIPHSASPCGREIAVVGQMGLERNARGLRAIANELLSYPADQRPRLIVASSTPPHSCLLGIPDDVVDFVGAVEDVRALYAASAACLVPSFLVMGSKTTVLQAWAAGVPVVTTAAAAASVGAVDGDALRSASDPAGVARALVEVVGDPQLQGNLASAGRRQLHEQYSLAAVGRALDELLGFAELRLPHGTSGPAASVHAMAGVDMKPVVRDVLRRPMRRYLSQGRRPGQLAVARKFVRGRFSTNEVDSATVFGATMRADLTDVIPQRVQFFGIWEPNLTCWMQDRLKPGDVVADIGAHQGYFTLLAARAVGPEGVVVAVEPSPHRMALLRRNVALNSLTNVRSIQVGIGAQRGLLNLFKGHDAASATTVVDGGRGIEAQIPVEPLAEALTEAEFSRLRVIKIDIEGREYDAVASLATMLDKVPDDFEAIIEITPTQNHALGRSPRDILNLLLPHGFTPHRLINDYAIDSYVDYARTRARVGPTPLSLDDPWWDSATGEQRDVIFSRVSAE